MTLSEIINSILLNADYFVLVFLRVGALVISSPIFGRVNIPTMAKICLMSTLSFLFFMLFPPVAEISYTTLFGFFIVCAGEIIIGLALAYVTNLFFTLAFTSGQLIDMQIGFGIVNVYDIQNNTQIPMTGNIINIMLLLVFFAVNGHLRLIDILRITMTKLPVGNLTLSPQIGMVALELFAMTFMLGIMVAMPILASGLILEICFGMLIRSVPQLNMMVVGIPLKTMLGMLMLVLIMPVIVGFSDKIFSELFIGVEKMFSALMAS